MMPASEFKRRIKAVRDVLKDKGLKSVLVYGAPAEDLEWIRWLFGTNTDYPTYLLITNKKETAFIGRWLTDDVKTRTRIKNIVPVVDREDTIDNLKGMIDSSKVGIVGLIPYSDLQRLRCKSVDLTKDYTQLMLTKSDYEIKMIRKACKVYLNSLEKTEIKAGMKEYEIAASIECSIKNRGSERALSTSVIGGKRLAITTYGTPSSYAVKMGDIVCVDGGACINTYNSDIARCFSVGKNRYFSYYEKLVKVQDSVINQLQIGDSSKDILCMYRKELEKYKLDKFLVPLDMGHGIGCGHHEPPSIGEDNYKIKENMVFTLEPELNLGNMRVRVEDMVLAKKHKMEKLSRG